MNINVKGLDYLTYRLVRKLKNYNETVSFYASEMVKKVNAQIKAQFFALL